MSPYKSLAIGLPVFLLGLLVFKFWEVESMVTKRLNVKNHGTFSMAYFRPVTYKAGFPINETILRKRLTRREYHETHGAPTRAGEYQCDKDSCTILLKSTSHADEATGANEPTSVNLRFADGRIIGAGGELLDQVTLEPQPLSPIGHGEMRAVTRLELSDMSPAVISAVLSTEDQRFYYHWGIDPIGIFRALIKNIAAGAWIEGGSTITQQLAKNVLLSPKKTLVRKFNELFAALSLEKNLTKDEILTMYLNEVYFSQEGSIAVHGIEEASHTFFGKSAKALSISEAALLIGLIKAPSYYSPRRHLDRAIDRRNVVLQNMFNHQQISAQEYETAKTQKIQLSESVLRARNAAYFMMQLEKEMSQNHDLDIKNARGLQVQTFLDEDFQACAEDAVKQGLSRIEKNFPHLKGTGKKALQQSLVAIDTRTGAILAWIGGRDYQQNQFDHVVQARRQIGSTIKPFLYLTSLDPSLNSYKVATTVSILGDEPTAIQLADHSTWRPENFDHRYRGDVTLRYALERSLNAPAVYVTQRVGAHNVKTTLERFKVAKEIPEVLALSLGALDTSLLELTTSFAALSQLGTYTVPRIFDEIRDQDGELLIVKEVERTQVSDPGPVFLVVDVLRGVIERGTGTSARSAGFKYSAAGKTGTSNEARDAWFIGFTPSLAVGVWTGFDDNRKTGLTGGSSSTPTWGDFMKCVQPLLHNEHFSPPKSVTIVKLDSRNRKQFHDHCVPDSSFVISEIFLKGTEPRFECYETSPYYDDYLGEQNHRADQAHRPMRRRTDDNFWDTIWDWG
jgi:penicillin-binding protein 1B